MTDSNAIPAVLVLAGNDPTGGAGIAADILALAGVGCHAAPVVTALTSQDTHRVHAYTAVDSVDLLAQTRILLQDVSIDAIKIGMVGSVANIEAIHTILLDNPAVPVVLDPVLTAGEGDELADAATTAALRDQLLPLATVLTPNSNEACALATGTDSLDDAAQNLLQLGCDYVLITGTHSDTPQVINTLYSHMHQLKTFTWPRLAGSYHGSGCTLASAIAGFLAQGNDAVTAIQSAQDYTYKTLQHGFRIGSGQTIPHRLFWARQDHDE